MGTAAKSLPSTHALNVNGSRILAGVELKDKALNLFPFEASTCRDANGSPLIAMPEKFDHRPNKLAL